MAHGAARRYSEESEENGIKNSDIGAHHGAYSRAVAPHVNIRGDEA